MTIFRMVALPIGLSRQEDQRLSSTNRTTGSDRVNYKRFYQRLFAPLADVLGRLDAETIVALIGFDAGGPLNFCTIGADHGPLVTYVSCELAVREAQQPASFGRYELLSTCDDEDWARSVLSDLGRMSLEARFDDGHTVDIGACVDAEAIIQGVVLEKLYATEIEGTSYGVLRATGVTRAELAYALDNDVPSLMRLLRERGIVATTQTRRSSVV